MTYGDRRRSGSRKGSTSREDDEREGDAQASAVTDVYRAIMAEAQRMVTLRANGRAESATLQEAVVKVLFKRALDGSAHALNQVFHMMRDAEALSAVEVAAEVAKGNEFRAVFAKELERVEREAKAEGLDAVAIRERTNRVVPHPDDIVVKLESGYAIVGPVDGKELASVLHTRATRDTFLLQHVLEARLDWPDGREERRAFVARTLGTDYHSEPITKGYIDAQCARRGTRSNRKDQLLNPPGSALLFAHQFDRVLPERFRWGEHDVVDAVMKIDRRTKRELLKDAYAAWRSVGCARPRGWQTPDFVTGARQLQATNAMLAEVTERLRVAEANGDRAFIDPAEAERIVRDALEDAGIEIRA